MSIDTLRDLVFDISLSTFGVPATVTPLNGAPIATTGIWLTPVAEDMPAAGDFQRHEMHRVIALKRAVVPSLQRGSTIAAAEREGGTIMTWRVDAVSFLDPDHLRAVMTPMGA